MRANSGIFPGICGLIKLKKTLARIKALYDISAMPRYDISPSRSRSRSRSRSWDRDRGRRRSCSRSHSLDRHRRPETYPEPSLPSSSQFPRGDLSLTVTRGRSGFSGGRDLSRNRSKKAPREKSKTLCRRPRARSRCRSSPSPSRSPPPSPEVAWTTSSFRDGTIFKTKPPTWTSSASTATMPVDCRFTIRSRSTGCHNMVVADSRRGWQTLSPSSPPRSPPRIIDLLHDPPPRNAVRPIPRRQFGRQQPDPTHFEVQRPQTGWCIDRAESSLLPSGGRGSAPASPGRVFQLASSPPPPPSKPLLLPG